MLTRQFNAYLNLMCTRFNGVRDLQEVADTF